jgi:hypothetical protein
VSKASDHEKISKILFQIDFLIDLPRALYKRTDGDSEEVCFVILLTSQRI